MYRKHATDMMPNRGAFHTSANFKPARLLQERLRLAKVMRARTTCIQGPGRKGDEGGVPGSSAGDGGAGGWCEGARSPTLKRGTKNFERPRFPLLQHHPAPSARQR